MAEVTTVAKGVLRRWLSQGLRVSAVTPEEMARLRQLQPDGRWEDYEAFLRIAGLPQDEDSEGFRFWLPREVRLSKDVLADAGSRCNAAEPSVIFADYLQECWWYGLWLAGPFAGQVSLVLGSEDGEDPQLPLGSLVEFLAAYLDDDDRLYPPE
jgi:hypothetical protein